MTTAAFEAGGSNFRRLIDSGWEGYHDSRRCSRDTYPESYITKYTSIRRLMTLALKMKSQVWILALTLWFGAESLDFCFVFLTLEPRVESFKVYEP